MTLEKTKMKMITPFLWFDHQAEQAVHFYLSVFKDGKIGEIKQKEGEVLTVTFELKGQEFIALNGGPYFKFTPAVSFFVRCQDQGEIDYYWEKLSEGGAKSQCGWLTDKYGLSWQIVPEALGDLLENEDAGKKDRIWKTLMQMTKIEIEALRHAAN